MKSKQELKDKQVYAVSVKGEFKQYLMISEAKYLQDMCKAFGRVTLELKTITAVEYKRAFGK